MSEREWPSVEDKEAAARAMCLTFYARSGTVKWRDSASTRKLFRKLADAAFAAVTEHTGGTR